MIFTIRKFYSGFCTYEVEANNEDEARGKVQNLPVDYEEVASTLEPWEEANEIEQED